MNRLCKTEIPSEISNFIRQSTSTVGKAKLILKHNKFYIESQNPEILKELLKNHDIAAARIFEEEAITESSKASANETNVLTNKDNQFHQDSIPKDDINNTIFSKFLNDDEQNENNEMDEFDNNELMNWNAINRVTYVSFMIDSSKVQIVKKAAKDDSKYPLIEEYDFRNDTRNSILSIDLKPSTKIRVCYSFHMISSLIFISLLFCSRIKKNHYQKCLEMVEPDQESSCCLVALVNH